MNRPWSRWAGAGALFLSRHLLSVYVYRPQGEVGETDRLMPASLCLSLSDGKPALLLVDSRMKNKFVPLFVHPKGLCQAPLGFGPSVDPGIRDDSSPSGWWGGNHTVLSLQEGPPCAQWCSVLLRTEDRIEGSLGPLRPSPAPRGGNYMKDSAGFMQRTQLCLEWWCRSISQWPRGRPAGRQAGCAPAVPLAHSVTLGQAQTLPRPPFPHPEQGVTVTPQAVLCS